jgi:light-regulated signal transduction histidine kinase (bacteriophytochrome)
MEMQLHAQNEELERSNHELERFAYAASHDLQEPLRAVTGCAQLLRRDHAARLDASARRLVEHIVDGGARMQALITDLLAYAQVSSRPIVGGPVDCGAAARQALDDLRASQAEAGAVVELGPLPVVRGDARQLVQVFQNLIGNAIKYRSAAPPRVEVSATRVDGQWRFAIRDNGIGIEQRYFDRIFALFQRLHTRSEYPGTGIGLALCQKIVQRHRGRIWVESALGHGATFYFTLPADEGGGA